MSRAPRLPPWSNDTLKFAQQLSATLSQSVFLPPEAMAKSMSDALRHYDVVTKPALQRALEQFQRTSAADLRRMSELRRRSTPDNWHELDSTELDVLDLVQQSGIPVVWAPRAEIIDALIAFAHHDRYSVLAKSSDDVLDDLGAVLERARGANVRGHADACMFASEALAAARDGHWNAAQALVVRQRFSW